MGKKSLKEKIVKLQTKLDWKKVLFKTPWKGKKLPV